MDSSSIELPGSEIERIRLHADKLCIYFSRAYVIKTMTGSVERTKWWQAGELIIQGARLEGEIPAGPLICAGGDVVENVYTYRDMIPIPLESRGLVRCELRFEATDARLLASGDSIHLKMIDVPKYIEHIHG